jgi:hypothetical protein
MGRVPKGSPGGVLLEVSCTSPGACTATGGNFRQHCAPVLVERWNGTAWSIQPAPAPPNYTTSFGAAALSGVSCASATACDAIGNYTPGNVPTFFIEAWNGTRWSLQPVATPGGTTSGWP